MGWRRPLEFLRWLPAAVLVAAVALAPAVASIADRRPEGRPRLTPFYLALTLSDDSARESIRHSLILAAAVAVLSGGIGVGLGSVASGRPSTGREALAALARAPGAYPPLFGALGIVGLFGVFGSGTTGAARWLVLGWVELAWSVPRVMRASERAFATVRPSWVDAARIAGLGRRRAFWSVAWPIARAPVALATGEVFALTLFEPSGPLVLGARRTLGYALVESAFSPDRLPRAGALAVYGMILAGLVRGSLRAWGGVASAGDAGSPPPLPAQRTAHRPASGMIALGAWAVAAWIAPLGLGLAALDFRRSGHVRIGALQAILFDGEALGSIENGLILGLGATTLAALLAWALGPRGSRPAWRSPGRWAECLPPVVVGLGVVCLPGLLDGLAAVSVGFVASVLSTLAAALDPFASPWTALIVGTAIPHFAGIQDAFAEGARRESGSGLDVARTLGAGRIGAWAIATAPGRAALLAGALAWCISASAIDSAPALLLAPTAEARPIAPSVRQMAAEPGGLRRASAVALIGLVIPVIAWIISGARDSERNRLSRR